MDGRETEEVSLNQLEGQAVAFLDLAESIGRPLRGAERNAFLWILQAFEATVIQASLASLPRGRVDYYRPDRSAQRGHRPSGMPPLTARRVDRLGRREALAGSKTQQDAPHADGKVVV